MSRSILEREGCFSFAINGDGDGDGDETFCHVLKGSHQLFLAITNMRSMSGGRRGEARRVRKERGRDAARMPD